MLPRVRVRVRLRVQGLGPTLLRAAPANAAVFLVYELSVRMLNSTMGGWLLEAQESP